MSKDQYSSIYWLPFAIPVVAEPPVASMTPGNWGTVEFPGVFSDIPGNLTPPAKLVTAETPGTPLRFRQHVNNLHIPDMLFKPGQGFIGSW